MVKIILLSVLYHRRQRNKAFELQSSDKLLTSQLYA